MSSSCGVCNNSIEKTPPTDNNGKPGCAPGCEPRCAPGCNVMNKYRIKYAMVKAVLQYYPQLGRS